ncbi:MAG: bifunctional folylpolyglutamate synthase/dihydrofolate synthase [Polyangiaceae bacterium]|nr:bifunctional folylpolyglutamate synthase/dihydrofolate synthase [Polyangiaceae bacterium]
MRGLAGVLERVYARIPAERQLGLERMEAACAALGHPERAFEAVHVAGTNGKGSVCAFVASMARAGGRRVGVYTSPHLVRFAERIQVDGAPIPDEVLLPLLERVLALDPALTFFEVATLAAFLAFRDAGVDLAVLEVGLGGRLDATNVIPPPRVAVLTRVAFDHQAELGDTLRAIAEEKVAIIKAGSAVVHGKLHPDARAALEARVAEVGARIVPLGSAEPTPGASLAYPRISMLGTNLAVATTVGRELGLSPEALAAGIEATTWPGRNELLHRNGLDLTMLDCAHNPDGAVILSHILDPSSLEGIESRRDVVLVFGALRGKNWRAMLDRLEHAAAHRVFVAPPVARAVPPEEMARAFTGEVASSIPEALARARAIVGERGLVVVTGSTYLVGAARAHLLGLPTDPAADS